jgi:hypothetical protein
MYVLCAPNSESEHKMRIPSSSAPLFELRNYLTNLMKYDIVGFEVLTAVVMKSTIFWDITPCSPLSVNQRFGVTYYLHLQGRKNMLSKKPA